MLEKSSSLFVRLNFSWAALVFGPIIPSSDKPAPILFKVFCRDKVLSKSLVLPASAITRFGDISPALNSFPDGSTGIRGSNGGAVIAYIVGLFIPVARGSTPITGEARPSSPSPPIRSRRKLSIFLPVVSILFLFLSIGTEISGARESSNSAII